MDAEDILKTAIAVALGVIFAHVIAKRLPGNAVLTGTAAAVVAGS